FFCATTIVAILIGFGVAALLLPLAPVNPDQQAALRQVAAADSGGVRHAAEQVTTGARFIVDLIPANPVRAAVDGNLLPLIVFVTIFAVAAAALPDEKRRSLTELAEAATQVLIRIVRWVLLLAPLATLPVMLEAAESDLRISRPVASFVLPLGASIGRGGSALFQAVAVLFVARLYGVSLGVGSTFAAGAAVFLASLTVASVPSA